MLRTGAAISPPRASGKETTTKALLGNARLSFELQRELAPNAYFHFLDVINTKKMFCFANLALQKAGASWWCNSPSSRSNRTF